MSETPKERIVARYREALSASFARSRGSDLLAGGVAHDSWRVDPHPVVFERAQRVHKWDVGGRRYIDLWMGHGSLLFGNSYPAVVEAVSRAVRDGQHVGGAHALHYDWAERVRELFPSCERVRFTASGTEATALALRVARAATERNRILRVDGHFHGWHEEALAHVYDPQHAGFRSLEPDDIEVVPPLDLGAVTHALTRGDVAALILEPGGGSAGMLPWSTEYLAGLARVTQRHGTLLIFDEVISGLRYHPGGVQGLSGIRPDITVLAKIAAGGMPGGIVGGRADVLSVLGRREVPHSGTFNGFPLSAAAALVTMDAARDGTAASRSEQMAERLVVGLNRAADAAGVDVQAFRQSSIFHLLIGARSAGVVAGPGPTVFQLAAEHRADHALLRLACLLSGVDCHASHGWISAVHEERDIDEALDAFSMAFQMLTEVPSFRISSPAPRETYDSCTDVCPNPICGSRFRVVAGCSVPLDDLRRRER